jgi:hypothetical protein
MLIPHDTIKPETLRNVIAEIVTRDGTDYGQRERSLDEKILEVMTLLECGEASLAFDEATETCTLLAIR